LIIWNLSTSAVSPNIIILIVQSLAALAEYAVARELLRTKSADSMASFPLFAGSELSLGPVLGIAIGAILTMLYLQFETEAEAALGLPPNVHSYSLLPIGYHMGRFGPVRLADVVFQDRCGQPYRDL
jgi:hypothetical protein